MNKNTLLYSTLALAIIGVSLFFLSNAFYFYWLYWWFDVLMHFLVPFTGGLGLYWGFFHSGLIFQGEWLGRSLSVVLVFLAVGAVVIGWEIFEYMNKFTQSTEGYYLDTINDVLIGGAAGLLAALVASYKRHE